MSSEIAFSVLIFTNGCFERISAANHG